MAFTLTIAGSNFLPQYVTNTLKIRELIQNKSNVAQFDIRVKIGQTAPAEGSAVVFKDGSRFLFAGFISKINPVETGKGQLFIYHVEVSDYSYIFNNKVAKRAYQNKTLNYIVTDLINTYVGTAYAFNLTNVATGPTLTTVIFDHISIRAAFEKLAKLTGYVWYVDYQKNLYFKTQTTTAAPESLTDAGTNVNELSITHEAAQVRNAVTVIGSDAGEEGNALTTETFTGDGQARIWVLGDTPSTISSITLAGVAQSFAAESAEVAANVFVYNAANKTIRMTYSAATPGVAVAIVVSYYPRIPIIVRRDDTSSIAYFAALDGGNGIYEYTIKDASITSKSEAAARAIQELADFADPLVNGQFTTRTSILSGGSLFAPGQSLTVNVATYGINSTFLIQEVNTTLVQDSAAGTAEYLYTVRFGGRLAGVQEFLESLAAQSDEATEATDIKTLNSTADVLVVKEDAAPTKVNQTPPFKYGPAGSPQGKWNKSEWA